MTRKTNYEQASSLLETVMASRPDLIVALRNSADARKGFAVILRVIADNLSGEANTSSRGSFK
jgi:hypothetical protein